MTPIAVALFVALVLTPRDGEVVVAQDHSAVCGDPRLDSSSFESFPGYFITFRSPGRFIATVPSALGTPSRELGESEMLLSGLEDCKTDDECARLVERVWTLMPEGLEVEILIASGEQFMAPGPTVEVLFSMDGQEDALSLNYFLLRNGYAAYDGAKAVGLGPYTRCELREASALAKAEKRGLWRLSN